VVVDDQDFRIGSNLGMKQADALRGETDRVIVVVGGHADAELFLFRRRHKVSARIPFCRPDDRRLEHLQLSFVPGGPILARR
jgi:hypothetical protein